MASTARQPERARKCLSRALSAACVVVFLLGANCSQSSPGQAVGSSAAPGGPDVAGLDRAIEAFRQGQIDEAERRLGLLDAQTREGTLAIRLLGQIRVAQGRLSDAVELFTVAYRSSSDDVLTLRALLQCLRLSGRPERALSILDERMRTNALGERESAVREYLLWDCHGAFGKDVAATEGDAGDCASIEDAANLRRLLVADRAICGTARVAIDELARWRRQNVEWNLVVDGTQVVTDVGPDLPIETSRSIAIGAAVANECIRSTNFRSPILNLVRTESRLLEHWRQTGDPIQRVYGRDGFCYESRSRRDHLGQREVHAVVLWSSPTLDAVLSHELLHAKFRSCFHGAVPLWYEEGLAIASEVRAIQRMGSTQLIAQRDYTEQVRSAQGRRLILSDFVRGNEAVYDGESAALSWIAIEWLCSSRGVSPASLTSEAVEISDQSTDGVDLLTKLARMSSGDALQHLDQFIGTVLANGACDVREK